MPVKMIVLHKYSDKWTNIGTDIGIYLGNNQDNFQLHRFTRRENTAKFFFFWGGGYFLTHTVYSYRNRTAVSRKIIITHHRRHYDQRIGV